MQKGVRPESLGPAPAVYAADAARYDGQNAQIQNEMAQLAVALLGGGSSRVLADIGCGSGLSSAALQAAGPPAVACVGLDITREMLELAAAQPGCRGHLAQVDFSHGLPLRPGCLDGAISVSAVQWLCAAGDPPAAIGRFFGALRRSLVPGGTAAMQVYAEGDKQAQQLVLGARDSGLNAGFFVSFPHPAPAKKYYVLVQRPQEEQHGQQEQQQRGSCLSQHCCNLAWPKTGSCILSWAQHLQQQGQHPGLQHAAERMLQEHSNVGKRVLRLLRQAEILTAEDSSSSSGGDGGAPVTDDGTANRSSGPVVLKAELDVMQHGLMPCGGAIFVQLTAAAALLSPAARLAQQAAGDVSHMQLAALVEGAHGLAAGHGLAAALATTLESIDQQQHVASTLAAAQQLLLGQAAGGSSGGSSGINGCSVLRVALKAAKPEDAGLHARQQPLRRFAAPPQGTKLKVWRFMRLEPLEALEAQQARLQPEAPPLVAAVFHISKMPQHLALRFSCSTSPCASCCGSSSGGGTCGNTACATHVARCMRAFCAAEGAIVVSLDAHLHPDRLDATWLLYMGQGLHRLDSSQLAATLRRNFA